METGALQLSLLDVKNLSDNGGIVHVGGGVATGVEKRIRFGDSDYVAVGEWSGQDDTLELKGTRTFLNSSWVGIGISSPTESLHVIGNILASGSITQFSSRRWKTNIQTLEGSLQKVERLRGVSYDWKADGKHDIGLIAEEVGAVVPEVVSYEANGVDAKGVDYARLTAVLIEAVKEQQAQIQSQEDRIRSLETEMEVLQAQRGVAISHARQ